ncbi:hypothetical protein ACFX2J_040974 [Malus domestica]
MTPILYGLSMGKSLHSWDINDGSRCHTERNVAENVIATLLEIEGKTKDVIRARANLVELGIRHDLHPRADGAHTKLPAVEYNMKPREKIMLCQVFLPIAIQKVLPKSVVIML